MGEFTEYSITTSFSHSLGRLTQNLVSTLQFSILALQLLESFSI